MITVSVVKIQRTDNGLSEQILEVPAANKLAETAASDIQKRVQHLTGDDHPGHDSTIIVRAKTMTEFDIDKSGLCCSKLSDRIKISVTKTA